MAHNLSCIRRESVSRFDFPLALSTRDAGGTDEAEGDIKGFLATVGAAFGI